MKAKGLILFVLFFSAVLPNVAKAESGANGNTPALYLQDEDVTVSGVVTSEEDGEPLAGVIVMAGNGGGGIPE